VRILKRGGGEEGKGRAPNRGKTKKSFLREGSVGKLSMQGEFLKRKEGREKSAILQG